MGRTTYPERLCQIERRGVEVPDAAIAKARRLYAELGPSTSPMQIAPDIWVCGNAISGHRDSTEEGKVTYGVLLSADGYYPEFSYGTGNACWRYDVEPGAAYVINAREYHSLYYKAGREGFIAFLAWDLPFDFTLQGFVRRAERRLRHWAGMSEPYTQPGAGI